MGLRHKRNTRLKGATSIAGTARRATSDAPGGCAFQARSMWPDFPQARASRRAWGYVCSAPPGRSRGRIRNLRAPRPCGEATFQSLGEIPPKEISLKKVSEKRLECRFPKSVPADRALSRCLPSACATDPHEMRNKNNPMRRAPLGAAAQKEHAPERRNFYCGDGSPRDVGCSGRLRLSGAVDVAGLSPSARFAARMGLCLFRPSGAFSCRIRNLRAPRPFWGSDFPVAC